MNDGANHSNNEQQPESGHSSPQVNLGTSMPLAAETESLQEVSTHEGYALWAASSGFHGILALVCAARMQQVERMVKESRRPSGRRGDA